MSFNQEHAWDLVLTLPETRRNSKPRTNGKTMVIDKGLGINETRDLLEWLLITSIFSR